MDWNASLGWILAAAFALGALHALEPGHGKSIMGAYLLAAHGGIRHAILLGLVVTATHTFVVFLLAFGALRFASGFAPDQTTFWLELVSGILVLAVGVWMTLTSFGVLRRRATAAAKGREHFRPHPHTRGETEQDPQQAHRGAHTHDDCVHGPHEHGAQRERARGERPLLSHWAGTDQVQSPRPGGNRTPRRHRARSR